MDTEIMETQLLQEKEVTKESGDDSGHATETEDEDSHDHDKEDLQHSSSPTAPPPPSKTSLTSSTMDLL